MKLKLFLTAIVYAFTMWGANAQITAGLRVPQLTTAQRNQIMVSGNPLAKGQAVYNTDTNCFEYWNGSKWVSLCLGTANIALTGSPCNYDPTALVPADGVQTDCEFTPADDPACVLQGQQAYQVYLTAGSSYTTLTVDELTSAFSVKFQPNISANNRIAVVRVVNNCSGEFQDFLFTQEGATCPAGANAFTVKAATQNLCGDNGAAIAYVENPQSGIDYLWEYGGVVVNTGNYMEITRAGKYTVYAGLMGCPAPTPQEITITKSAGNSASAPVVTVSNSGILCNGGNVILTASNITDPQVKWFHDGVYSGQSANPLTLSGAAAAGEWFAIQHSAGGCGSYASNSVVLADQTATGTALAAPVATVNGTALSGTPTVCKGGTLELAVTNVAAYPAGTIYQWFDNGVKIAESTNAVIYAVASSKSAMVLSVQVSNNSGGCPNTATSSAIAVNFTASAPTTINNGASTEAICGSTPAMLMATNSAGVDYEWFHNGTTIPSVNTSSYSATQQGDYTVRYQDSNNCWSLVSNSIEVVQSAAISMSWQSEPKATAVIGNQESFTVLASPAPDSYTWTSSDPAVATVTPIDGGKSVSVNYLADGTFTLRVEVRNSCGMVFLEKNIKVEPGCTPITSVNLTPSGTVTKNLDETGSPKTSGDGITAFTATATNGSPATSYEWFVGGVEQTGQTAQTFNYTTPATAGTYTVTARAYNACTGMPGSSNGTVSATTTVKVNKDAPADVSGKYRMNGKTCFDVKRGNDNNTCMPLASRKDNFALTKSFAYTFSSPVGSAYSDLTFSLTDNNALIASTTTANNVFTVTFRSDINDVARGTDKTTAKKLTIVARYKDNSGSEKQITLEVSVQDCSCGCSVKSTLYDGWLTFMCYNVGVSEATKNMTLDEQMAYSSPTGTGVTDATVYGDLYQWGRQADGHQIRSNSSVKGPYTGVLDSNGQVPSTASAYYGHFITNVGASDWRNSTNTLWSVSKTANDPCPVGWRVPARAEWASIMSGGVTTNLTVSNGKVKGTSGNTWTWKNSTGTHGYAISPDGNTTTLFLPAAGNHYGGTAAGYLDKAGSYGYYWTVTTDNTASYPLIFSGTTVTISGSLNRVYGFSVRCVAE
ncbi:MAG: hypothetical protein LBN27_08585 [Prevotellaceae bacterium]|jgi:uncharacterized protein (TIGR02145 family)|nr:hypothetical protein [Prevotellaceae bacterium]